MAYTGNRKAEILSASVGNFSHADKKEFEDFADCHLIGENGATGYIRVDWFTPQSFPVFGDGKVVILGTKGTIELRKYIDVGVNGVTETVLLSTEEESRKFSVKGQIEKPFFRNIIKDCLHRTYTASDIERTLYTMELAITAQQKAQKIAEK